MPCRARSHRRTRCCAMKRARPRIPRLAPRATRRGPVITTKGSTGSTRGKRMTTVRDRHHCIPPGGARNNPRRTEVEAALREQLRVLLNAPDSADIALLKNTSEGLSLIAYGLTWAAGDNIVISDEEFPSNRIVWESLRPNGVEVREARLTDGISPEEALLHRVDGR